MHDGEGPKVVRLKVRGIVVENLEICYLNEDNLKIRVFLEKKIENWRFYAEKIKMLGFNRENLEKCVSLLIKILGFVRENFKNCRLLLKKIVQNFDMIFMKNLKI